MPRLAQRRVILFFWPMRASSWNQTSISAPADLLRAICASRSGKFFKSLGGVLVVGVMPRPGRELAEAHRPQLPAQSLLGNPDAVLLPNPLRQVDQPPAHDPMDRRDRAALDDAGEFLALGAVELGRPSWCLAIDETVRPPGIEPQHPVADCLQTDTANARRLPARAAVVNLGKRQKAPALVRVPRLLRQPPQHQRVKVFPQRDWTSHGKPPPFAMLNQIAADS